MFPNSQATGPGLSDEAISEMMSKVLNGKELTPEMREKMMGLQKNLKAEMHLQKEKIR